MAEIRGTISEDRAVQFNHHIAECFRILREEPGFDAWDEGELGKPLQRIKDEINRRTVEADRE